MANYNTNLKTWGSTGTEYPDGYNYVEGEQPVDAWDNFFNSNTVDDLQHLINLTNKRLETDIDTAFPTSPEDGHVVYRTDQEEVYVYDSTNGVWHNLLRADLAELENDLTDDQANTIWDYTNQEIPDAAMGTIEDSTLADPRTDVSDSGTAVVTDVTDINFNTDLGVTDDGDGSVTVDGTATDTRTDVSDNGTTVVADTSDINFADAGTSVTDDGDGTVSVTEDYTWQEDGNSPQSFSSVTSVSYTLASSYDRVKVEVEFSDASSSSRSVALTINGDTTSSYYRRDASGSESSGLSSWTLYTTGSNPSDVVGEFELSGNWDNTAVFSNSVASNSNDRTEYGNNINATSPLDSFAIDSGAQNISGTIRVYGKDV